MKAIPRFLNIGGFLRVPNSTFELAKKKNHIAYFPDEECLINLAGNYNYLETPYYTVQDLENDAKEIHPTNKESLDGYIAPLFLEKARLADLPIPAYYITNSFFEPPVIVDTINPFMQRTRFVLKASRQAGVAKSLTRNFTYAVCCQEIPAGADVKYFRTVLGWSISRRYRDLARSIWKTFKIPIARIRVLVLENGEILLSSIDPLPFAKLNSRELAYIQTKVIWPE